jgi:NADPH-dependent 2,4-dienoyl-CoA reductase/sulfur reductase-like enzyme
LQTEGVQDAVCVRGDVDKRVAIIGGGLGGMSFLNAALHTGLKKVQLYEHVYTGTDFAELTCLLV